MVERKTRPRAATTRRRSTTKTGVKAAGAGRGAAKPPAAEPVPAASVLNTGPAVIVPASTAGRFGPLLQRTLSGLEAGGIASGVARFALDTAEAGAPPVLPLSLSIPRISPAQGERWPAYKQRVLDMLGPLREWLQANAGLTCEDLVAGNGLETRALVGQIREAARDERLKLLELDPTRVVTAMDDAVRDIELPLLQARHPALDGAGVRVAVLDSGIDTKHPWLVVADSVSTCGEPVAEPGGHGTHVAGSIASRDDVYRGIAPGVTLINIKVLTAAGNGQAGFVTRGVDEALDRQAHILSMSLGFNHLPTWSDRGHGWFCPHGDCVLCTAVKNAVALEGVAVVVAAGNEHARAEFLRSNGLGNSFDSEICCPGAATAAITVGALTKQTFLTAAFSSRGPTAFGAAKPDIAAPGVNITSAIPARRDAAGAVVPHLTRAELSGRDSGTSMATPIVSGVLALMIQRRLAAGQPVDAASLRLELLTNGFQVLARPAAEVGMGRLSVGRL